MKKVLLFGTFALLAACADRSTTPTGAEPSAALSASGGAGNSGNAQSCQKGGWEGFVTGTGATFKNVGDCVSYAAQGGILYKPQTITFAALADKTFGDADFTVSATASSGLPVSFSATGNCTVLASTVHLTGAGSCTITRPPAHPTTTT